MTNKAVEYAKSAISGECHAPKYVILQCEDFLKVINGESDKYCFDEKLFKKICKILKVLKMARGPMAGKPIYQSLAGFQWLLIAAALCIKYKDDITKRRYTKVVMEICRKNGKTFVVAVLFMLLFFLEDPFSRFHSVAPTGALAKEIKEALEPLLHVNSEIFEKGEFKITRDFILHKPNSIRYIPLNYSTSEMDGREPVVYIADEIGALPTNYPIEAMESGQIFVKNPIGFVISTKYPTIDNPLEDEVANAKNVLNGNVEDESLFALLFEPDNVKDWMEDDEILLQGNPLAIEFEETWDRLLKKRQDAINREALRENFLTKHCNIIYQGAGTETYIDTAAVQRCRVDKIDWTGRSVFVGVDLSQSGDNTSVTMVSFSNGTIYAKSFAFVPDARIDEKSKTEKVNYRAHIENGSCFACGDYTIDYSYVEDFVFDLEKNFGVKVEQIGCDPWNCESSAQKWDEKYTVVMIKQHSSVLHPATKLLYEKIMNQEFAYERNDLMEINFQNARCSFDTNLNRYVNKKKSSGKVDMVVSMINAVYLLQRDKLDNTGFVVQVI